MTTDQAGGPRAQFRPWHIAVLLAVLAAGAAVAVDRLARSSPLPPATVPPELDLSEVDPAVAHAVSAARDAVLADPRSAAAWSLLAMQLVGHCFPDAAALPVLAEAERLDPLDPRWPYHQGLLLGRVDPQRAIDKLRRAVELSDDKFDPPRLRLAEALLAQDQLEAAELELRALLKAQPGHPRAELLLARTKLRGRDLPAAIEHVQRAAADRHTRKQALELLAQIRARSGDAAGARNALELAARQPPDVGWPDPLSEQPAQFRTGLRVALARADQLLSQHQPQAAIDALQALTVEHPGCDQCWLLLGRGYADVGQAAQAEKALQKAIQLAPDSPDPHFHLGVALFHGKRWAAAADQFERAAALEPSLARSWYNLADCRRMLGDRPAAIRALRVALQCQPGYAAAHEDLGDLLADEGHPALAVEHWQHAIELDPSRQHARDRLAEVHGQAPPASTP